MTPPRRRVPILLYHSVVSETTPVMAPFDVHPEQFAAHVDYLALSKWQPIPLADWAAWVRAPGSIELPEHPVVLTFDDGFRDFLGAASILRQYEFPVTLFVPSAHAGDRSTWLEDERPLLDWEELRGLAADGVEIGMHAHVHRPLDELRTQELEHDVAESRRAFVEHFGAEPRAFAYPHGYHDRRVIRAVQASGFEYACAVRDSFSLEHDDPFAISRLFVGWDIDVPALGQLLENGRRRPRRNERLTTRGWRAARRVRRRVREFR